ncbi:MAG TPA: pesticin [Cyanobacteria bacterium UBA11691]|nr:pesticin [Cyanobacteria bacterium UBA11691]
MKTEFRTKFLSHLIAKKGDEGFTLIELLVVIIIIGILSAIALPSFLNQANKAKQSEAKQYTGSMNRQQQAYFLEKDIFTTTLTNLGLGIQSQTENYVYAISGPTAGQPINQDAVKGTGVNNYGWADSNTLKSYLGSVQTGEGGTVGNLEATTLAKLMESDSAGVAKNTLPSAKWSPSNGDQATGPYAPTDWTAF